MRSAVILSVFTLLGHLLQCPFLVFTLEAAEKERPVRILLASGESSLTILSSAKAQISGDLKRISARPGSYVFKIDSGAVRCSAHGKSALFGLRADLESNEQFSFSYGGKKYRGRFIVSAEPGGKVSLINELPVEEYLRGVVPLEIGYKPAADSSAVQAQAVAARTYTYLRMVQRKSCSYDLLPTVSDQVYGGVSAEHPVSDKAVRSTKNIVMLHKGHLIEAYYHSTCGGETAAKHEVWGGVSVPYLQSRTDKNDNGSAYCTISPRITWEEKWKLTDFNRIIRQYSSQTAGQDSFRGSVSSVIVTGKTPSGRVEKCSVAGAGDTSYYGGDKIRSVFRRPSAGNPILFSSNFSICRFGDEVIARGRGYGHGIGMCQMGAVGRARCGQSYKQILSAYYTDVAIENINNCLPKE